MRRGTIDLVGRGLEPPLVNLSPHPLRRIGLKSRGRSVEKGNVEIIRSLKL